MNYPKMYPAPLARPLAIRLNRPMALALLALATCAAALLTPAKPVRADGPTGTACVSVVHSYPPTTDEDPVYEEHEVAAAGINDSTYRVKYRLHLAAAGDQDWSDWMMPREEAQAQTPLGAFVYMYTTADHDMSRYDLAEFQVWLQDHPGIDTHTGQRVWGDQGGGFQNTMLVLDTAHCDTSRELQWNWFWAPYQKRYIGSTLRIAPGLASRVSPAVISDALANPDAVEGYNRLANLNLPEGPQNSLRTCLALSNPNVAWHPLFNGLVFTAGCR